ncbi:uncharacterized protein LOC117577724 [Drosophila albomicans]|uniref:Uncharacterized protein LOC117577724 n=1 Tax=Drosophila albomicans TaxID=7291 RepID=A0A6P8XYC2_DROAB|nr:uncharacterized protein LOC117577724 [Drosophila albomicans]
MTSHWICVTVALILCLCSWTWAAPSIEHWSKIDEMERTIKELATTVLAMNGAGAEGRAADGLGTEIGDGEINLDVLSNEAAAALAELT